MARVERPGVLRCFNVQYTMQHADGKAAVGPVIEDSNTHSLSTADLSGELPVYPRSVVHTHDCGTGCDGSSLSSDSDS